MRRMGLSLILICATFISVAAKADTVIKDSRDPANWSNILDVLDQRYFDVGASPFAVAPFEGNGRELSKIGLNYSHSAGPGHPNEGNPLVWDWRVSFWETFADFLADPKGETLAQHWVFGSPSNPDYLEQVGFNGMYNVYYAEINLAPLHIQTHPGVTHVITLAMKPTGGGGGNIPQIMYSNGLVGVEGEEDWWQVVPYLDPLPVIDVAGVEDHAAFYVSTKSPAACHGFICISARAHNQVSFRAACIPGVNC